jgi:hypothetical protein
MKRLNIRIDEAFYWRLREIESARRFRSLQHCVETLLAEAAARDAGTTAAALDADAGPRPAQG